MVTGAAQMDGAIVVAATDGPMPQTRASIRSPGLFLEWLYSWWIWLMMRLQVVEMEIRDLLSFYYEYDGTMDQLFKGLL
jgi:translation elongation factor EF-Tu-like GTPase